MTYVINEPCIGTKDASCVDVCPVDCIHPTPDDPDFAEHEQLYIDPEECIDCDACVEACPVDAITQEDMAPCRVGEVHRDQRGLLQGESGVSPDDRLSALALWLAHGRAPGCDA